MQPYSIEPAVAPTHDHLRTMFLAATTKARGVRAYDLARTLEVSELSLTLARLGDGVTLLEPAWNKLMPRLGELGEVMGLTRNEACVIEKHGHWAPFSMAGPATGLVLDAGLDLRLFLSRFAHVLAVRVDNPRKQMDSIQFFDAEGRAVHKLFLLHETSLPAYEKLVADFAVPDQRPPIAVLPWPRRAPEVSRQLDAAEVASFRNEWRQLRDTHDFFGLTRRFGLARLDAVKLGPPEFVRQVGHDVIQALLEHAVATAMPIMAFVGNDACIGIHTGPIRRAMPLGDWMNVMDPDFNLHLSMSAVASVYVVQKPTDDGIVTSIEVFDAEGIMIVQFFGARKPGQAELVEWRDFVATLA